MRDLIYGFIKFYFKGLFKMAVVFFVIPAVFIPLIIYLYFLTIPSHVYTAMGVTPIFLIAPMFYWRKTPPLIKAALLWLAILFFIMGMTDGP